MDNGAAAAGELISLAGQVFKIGMEGMVVVVKIAGKGAAHTAALLAAALSGKKRSKGRVVLKNMLKDSKGLTVFSIQTEEIKSFANAAKKYGVRFCLVKDKNSEDGITDMFIRSEDASIVSRIIERYKLTAVKQDVVVENSEEALDGQNDYVYGDVTISKDLNSLVEEETETQIKTRVPGTFGKNVRYVYFDKAGIEEVHGGKSYKVHIEPKGSYDLYDAYGEIAVTVSGEELLVNYDRKDDGVTVTPGNSRARTISEAQSGKNYSAEKGRSYVALESYYDYSGGDMEHIFDRRCRLLCIGENGEITAYAGHEGFFGNEEELNAYLEEHTELMYVSKDTLKEIAEGRQPDTDFKRPKEKAAEKPSAAKQSATKQPKQQSAGGLGRAEKTPDYVYGDVTISKSVNSLIEAETDTQVMTRVPGTYGESVRYVYFDKAGLEEVHGGKSYKVHIEPEGSYKLYDAAGNALQSVKGSELLTHYDRKDNQTEEIKPDIKGEARSGISPEAPVRGEVNAAVPNTRNRFNKFGQRTYDFDAMEKEWISNNKPSMAEEAHKEERSPAEKYDLLAVNDDGEILAYSTNEDTLENRNDKVFLSNTKLPRHEPLPGEEFRPSVREKLEEYEKDSLNARLEKEVENKRAKETKRLDREGGDVLPEQMEKINAYTKERDAAMKDFLSDAKTRR